MSRVLVLGPIIGSSIESHTTVTTNGVTLATLEPDFGHYRAPIYDSLNDVCATEERGSGLEVGSGLAAASSEDVLTYKMLCRTLELTRLS